MADIPGTLQIDDLDYQYIFIFLGFDKCTSINKMTQPGISAMSVTFRKHVECISKTFENDGRHGRYPGYPTN